MLNRLMHGQQACTDTLLFINGLRRGAHSNFGIAVFLHHHHWGCDAFTHAQAARSGAVLWLVCVWVRRLPPIITSQTCRPLYCVAWALR